jgi:hypothetical protein
MKRKAKKILNKVKKKKNKKKNKPVNYNKIIEEMNLTKRLRIDNYTILLSLIDSGD